MEVFSRVWVRRWSRRLLSCHWFVKELSDTRTRGLYWVSTAAKVAEVTADMFRIVHTN